MKKTWLIPIALTALTPMVSMVGCGDDTSKADFVCDDSYDYFLDSNEIDVEANKTYTVAVDLSKLNHNKTFTGYRLEANKTIAFIGDYPILNPELCKVRINGGEFKKAHIGEETNIIIDEAANYSKIEFIVGFKEPDDYTYFRFIPNPS